MMTAAASAERKTSRYVGGHWTQKLLVHLGTRIFPLRDLSLSPFTLPSAMGPGLKFKLNVQCNMTTCDAVTRLGPVISVWLYIGSGPLGRAHLGHN